MSDSSSLRAVLYALRANTGIFLAKSAAAVVTGSSAMLAEAIHSLADCGNQVLVAAKARVRTPVPGARQLVEAINGIEVMIKADFPVVRWVFFEPDIVD